MVVSARQEEQRCGVQVCLMQQICPVWLQATVRCMLVILSVAQDAGVVQVHTRYMLDCICWSLADGPSQPAASRVT
jgi:hypothetical protein